MIRRIQLMMLCSVLCWLSANTAQAGFVSPDFLDGPSSGPISKDQAVQHDEQPAQEQQSKLMAFLGINDAFNAQSSTTGMSGGNASSVHTSVSGLATATVPELEPEPLSGYLFREADFVLPDAFLDRVFRPPRLNVMIIG